MPASVETSPASDGSSTVWLRKPLASAGGGRISVWAGQGEEGAGELRRSRLDQSRGEPTCERWRNWYWQERIEGLSASAVFVAAGGRAVFLRAVGGWSGGVEDRHQPVRLRGFGRPAGPFAQQQQAFIAIGSCLAAIRLARAVRCRCDS